jgi:hypothetical protein
MTSDTHAHSFTAWFHSKALERIAASTETETGCAKIFDRYENEVWEIASAAAVRCGKDVSAWLAEHFGFDLIDSLVLLKACMVRHACEVLAIDTLRPMAA